MVTRGTPAGGLAIERFQIRPRPSAADQPMPAAIREEKAKDRRYLRPNIVNGRGDNERGQDRGIDEGGDHGAEVW